jgi:hypothetical protein
MDKRDMTGERLKDSTDIPKPEKPKPAPEEESIFDRVMSDGLKKGFGHLLRDSRIRNIVGDLKLPKEIVNHIISQVDETKQATVGVVSREVREFLENTNLADELAKLLTQISFEIKTQVRFVPSDKAMKGGSKTTVGNIPNDKNIQTSTPMKKDPETNS